MMKKRFILMMLPHLDYVIKEERLLNDPKIENASISYYFDGKRLRIYVKAENQAFYDNKILDEIKKHMAFRNMETYEDFVTLICTESLWERKNTIKKLKKLCLEYNYTFEKLGNTKNIN